ncbi:LOG family protein, partial [Klebsiella pneumoniae]|nr:LOG family protein [Klebsiella pneumoniae]
GAAREVGRALAERGLTLVYGGGHIGLMGALADAALAAGGTVVGVMPQGLIDWELAHSGLSRLEVVPDMLTRKARMAELADAFIALP